MATAPVDPAVDSRARQPSTQLSLHPHGRAAQLVDAMTSTVIGVQHNSDGAHRCPPPPSAQHRTACAASTVPSGAAAAVMLQGVARTCSMPTENSPQTVQSHSQQLPPPLSRTSTAHRTSPSRQPRHGGSCALNSWRLNSCSSLRSTAHSCFLLDPPRLLHLPCRTGSVLRPPTPPPLPRPAIACTSPRTTRATGRVPSCPNRAPSLPATLRPVSGSVASPLRWTPSSTRRSS